MVLCHDKGVIDDEEFCLLYDANRSKNPEHDFRTKSMENLILKIWTMLDVKRNFASIKETSRCWRKSLVYPKLSPAARDP